jgi:hypothetical protein
MKTKKVVHKYNAGGRTVCGVNSFGATCNKTFKGVTCGRCLRVKNKKVTKKTKVKLTRVRSASAAYGEV